MDYRVAKSLLQQQVQNQRLVLWEQTKGYLRAHLASQGQGPEKELLYEERQARYEVLRNRIEGFIKEMEDEGLHE